MNAVDFGDHITYSCEDNEPKLYFEEDRNMTDFQVQCVQGGRWVRPMIWPKCAESKLLRLFNIYPYKGRLI